jgi:hypothetical protein
MILIVQYVNTKGRLSQKNIIEIFLHKQIESEDGNITVDCYFKFYF